MKNNYQNARRLGKKGDKPRPLLITYDSPEAASTILKQAKALGKEENKQYKGIAVKKDMTPLEREEYKKLIQLRNQKREEATANKTGEIWVIHGTKVVDIARRKPQEEESEPKAPSNASTPMQTV